MIFRFNADTIVALAYHAPAEAVPGDLMMFYTNGGSLFGHGTAALYRLTSGFSTSGLSVDNFNTIAIIDGTDRYWDRVRKGTLKSYVSPLLTLAHQGSYTFTHPPDPDRKRILQVVQRQAVIRNQDQVFTLTWVSYLSISGAKIAYPFYHGKDAVTLSPKYQMTHITDVDVLSDSSSDYFLNKTLRRPVSGRVLAFTGRSAEPSNMQVTEYTVTPQNTLNFYRTFTLPYSSSWYIMGVDTFIQFNHIFAGYGYFRCFTVSGSGGVVERDSIRAPGVTYTDYFVMYPNGVATLPDDSFIVSTHGWTSAYEQRVYHPWYQGTAHYTKSGATGWSVDYIHGGLPPRGGGSEYRLFVPYLPINKERSYVVHCGHASSAQSFYNFDLDYYVISCPEPYQSTIYNTKLHTSPNRGFDYYPPALFDNENPTVFFYERSLYKFEVIAPELYYPQESDNPTPTFRVLLAPGGFGDGCFYPDLEMYGGHNVLRRDPVTGRVRPVTRQADVVWIPAPPQVNGELSGIIFSADRAFIVDPTKDTASIWEWSEGPYQSAGFISHEITKAVTITSMTINTIEPPLTSCRHLVSASPDGPTYRWNGVDGWELHGDLLTGNTTAVFNAANHSLLVSVIGPEVYVHTAMISEDGSATPTWTSVSVNYQRGSIAKYVAYPLPTDYLLEAISDTTSRITNLTGGERQADFVVHLMEE